MSEQPPELTPTDDAIRQVADAFHSYDGASSLTEKSNTWLNLVRVVRDLARLHPQYHESDGFIY